MSLILEALRKSEERRRLGETPTLVSESAWSARRRHPLAQRNRRPLWLLLAVIVLAAPVATWWLMRDPAPDAPVTARAERAAAPAPRPSPVATPTPAMAPPATSAVPEAAPPAVVGPTVVEPAPPPVPTVVSAPVPETTPVQLAASDPAPPPSPVELQSTPMPTEPPATEPPVVAPPAATPAPVAAAPPTFDSVPQIWQLALPTRQALPALELTMHVYSADPAQRFALINDKRVAEGSPVENDLDVREIRPDGVVLEFRGERFLLPRNGR